MSENRLPDYLEHMEQAAQNACDFVEGLAKEDFFDDKRTQQAVIMMRGMRNRIAHGYFDINLDVVWDTVQTALPQLVQQLSALQSGPDASRRSDPQ